MNPTVAAAWDLVTSTVWGTRCAGCGTDGTVLCERCRALLGAAPLCSGRGGLRVCASAPYDGVAGRIVRVYKERGVTALARPLGAALAALIPPGCIVVPVPPRRAALRARGYDAVRLMARRGGLDVRACLRWREQPGDQRGLGREERARNVSRRLLAERCEGLRVVIVDDVCTTGATLRAAAEALSAAGADVDRAAVIALTPVAGTPLIKDT